MSTPDNDKVLSLQKASDLLKVVISKEKIIDPTFEISSGSEKGDGFTSFMTKVQIKGKNKELALIIKCAPKNSTQREVLPTRLMFLREIKYYQEIFPAFKKVELEKNVEKFFTSAPICYKTSDLDCEELLVLEDLRSRNFKVFPKKLQMNEAHIEMVLKTYAHLHALSFAMKEFDPKGFEKLAENSDYLVTSKHMNEGIKIVLDGSQKIANIFNESEEPEVYNYYKDLEGKVLPFFDLLANYDGKNGVFVHGDSWCNNMMFKYDGEEFISPTEIRLLDFQIGSLMPAAIDVIYFFYVSASPEMMENFEHYQKIYHDNLTNHMKEMGCDVEKYYPYFVFKEDWKKYAQIGLYFSTCIYRVRFQGDDEIMDFTDASPTDALMKSSRFDDVINKKYREIAMHFYKNKFV